MRELCQVELDALHQQSMELLDELPSVLLPKASTSTLPALMSLNAGVGGDEATLCTAMLVRMYQRLAEVRGWDVEIVSRTDGCNVYGADGIKEITMKISSAYGTLQWESGVHRLQRVPPNEKMGRMQTSTVGVIVSRSAWPLLIQVLPVVPETDTELVDPKDVQTEVMRSRGAGGQVSQGHDATDDSMSTKRNLRCD